MAIRNQSKPRKPRHLRSQPKAGRPQQGRATRTPEPASPATAIGSANPARKPQFEWVTFEHRDSEGNLTFPESLIQSTCGRQYSEVEDGTEIRALVLTGYKPNPLMLLERKIYEVYRLTIEGWRRRGQIRIELDGWRGHEKHWFSAMLGIDVEISDPNRPRHTKGDKYKITKTGFERKMVTTHHRDGKTQEVSMYGGTLDITETWKSVWRRQGGKVIDMALRYVVLPFSVAFGAGVAVLSFQGSSENSLEPPERSVLDTTSVESGQTGPSDSSGPTGTSRQTITRGDKSKSRVPLEANDREPNLDPNPSAPVHAFIDEWRSPGSKVPDPLATTLTDGTRQPAPTDDESKPPDG